MRRFRPDHSCGLRAGAAASTPRVWGGAFANLPVVVALALLLLSTVAASMSSPRAEVFHSRESALRLAFPDADDVLRREIFLDPEQRTEVERRARVALPSRLVTVYVGVKDHSVLGYAFIETHKVRSLTETILVVIAPDGRTRGVHLLAFHEPPEYAPTDRWLAQFEGRRLHDEPGPSGEVEGITGATLTANSINASVRRILAVFEVAVAGSDAEGVTGGAPVDDATAKGDGRE